MSSTTTPAGGPWEELFDGKTLEGWEVPEKGRFRGHGSVAVEDGCLILKSK